MNRKLLYLGLCFISALVLAGCAAGSSGKAERLDFSGVEVEALQTYKAPRTSLRGFTASADGSYLYGGFIKGGPRGVYKIDAQTGEDVWYYQDRGYSQPGFCKGVAVDDRGYVYVGITIWEQEGEVQIAVLDDDNGQELSLTPISTIGKVGINGVTVRKDGDKYLLYLITNYQTNAVYCYDITDVNAPIPYTDFGVNGVMDIPALVKSDFAEGTALAFAKDGSFYMTANLGSGNKGDSVLYISKDGKKILKQTVLNEAYGLDLYDSYLFVSTYLEGISSVHVLGAADLKEEAEVGNLPDCTQYTGVAFRNGKLYIADQSFEEGSRILVSAIADRE